jgi:hypothetical protein
MAHLQRALGRARDGPSVLFYMPHKNKCILWDLVVRGHCMAPLQRALGRAKDGQGVDDEDVVDVDEKCNPLVSVQSSRLRLLQLLDHNIARCLRDGLQYCT